MLVFVFHGNILSNPFCQGRSVYFKTPIAAIHHVKRTSFTSRTFGGHCVYLRKGIAVSDFFAELVAVIFP